MADVDIRLRFPNKSRKEAAKWEYKVITSNNDRVLESELNRCAAEGWLVHTFHFPKELKSDSLFAAVLQRDATGAEHDSAERAGLLKEIKRKAK